eukprot:scaffold68763_cov63-Phaeocystis_antarctica.AAC.3
MSAHGLCSLKPYTSSSPPSTRHSPDSHLFVSVLKGQTPCRLSRHSPLLSLHLPARITVCVGPHTPHTAPLGTSRDEVCQFKMRCTPGCGERWDPGERACHQYVIGTLSSAVPRARSARAPSTPPGRRRGGSRAPPSPCAPCAAPG